MRLFKNISTYVHQECHLILELDHTHIEHYNLGAEYCRQTFRQDGVYIFVHEKLKFSNVNLY
jgi:hypothetical protein